MALGVGYRNRFWVVKHTTLHIGLINIGQGNYLAKIVINGHVYGTTAHPALYKGVIHSKNQIRYSVSGVMVGRARRENAALRVEDKRPALAFRSGRSLSFFSLLSFSSYPIHKTPFTPTLLQNEVWLYNRSGAWPVVTSDARAGNNESQKQDAPMHNEAGEEGISLMAISK